jgi:dienelactone hydrolase
MQRAKTLIAAVVVVAACLVAASRASAAVRTKEVEYTQGTTTLQGFLAWDDAAKGRRPGVLVVHEWWGLNQHARNQAKRLAEAGYVAFALDMYGKGKVTTHPDQAQAFASEAAKDPATMAARFDAAMQQLKQDPHVDPGRISAIGYCFGGAVVLATARGGASLDAVVSFHGAIPPSAPIKRGTVKARVLILAGGADPMVPADQVSRFENELKAAGAGVRVVTYPNAKHSFTNPDADKSGVAGLEYNAEADRQSFSEMLNLFKEIWG